MTMLPEFSAQRQTRDLCQAAQRGDVDAIQRMVPWLLPNWACGAIPPVDLSMRNERGILEHQALVYAAGGGHLDAVTLLIGHGAGINRRGHDGQTPLHEAVMHNQTAMVRHLVAHDADLTTTGSMGHTPLMLAVAMINVPMTGILLDLGAAINGRGSLNNTALHMAAENRTPEMVTMAVLLMQAGIDMALVNELGHTALEQAMITGGGTWTPVARSIDSELARRRITVERQALQDALGQDGATIGPRAVDRRRL